MEFSSQREPVVRGMRVSRPISLENVEYLEVILMDSFYGILSVGRDSRVFNIMFNTKEAFNKSIEFLKSYDYYLNGDLDTVYYAPNGIKVVLMAVIVSSQKIEELKKSDFSFDSAVGTRRATLEENWFIPGDYIVTYTQYTDVEAREGRPPVRADFKEVYFINKNMNLEVVRREKTKSLIAEYAKFSTEQTFYKIA